MARKLSDLDAKIIRLLTVDGRLPNTAIARRLGVAESTVRKHIDWLLRGGVMQIGAWTDPLKIGYQIYAIIEMEVDLSKIESAAKRLALLPEIFFLGICTGRCDIYAAAIFRSNDHLHEFMTRRLARVQGIQRTYTSSMTRIVKREYSYPVPITKFAVDTWRGSPVLTSLRVSRSRDRRSARSKGIESVSSISARKAGRGIS